MKAGFLDDFEFDFEAVDDGLGGLDDGGIAGGKIGAGGEAGEFAGVVDFLDGEGRGIGGGVEAVAFFEAFGQE